jgi:hypothetical protein
MSAISEKQILSALHRLDTAKWTEVLAYITRLEQDTLSASNQQHTHPMTAADLLQSPLVGLWADRDDIIDASTFARELREQAEHRHLDTIR